eukprot:COSAG01_NODE_939_length_12606_cov_97.306308_1_plen_256_part_00
MVCSTPAAYARAGSSARLWCRGRRNAPSTAGCCHPCRQVNIAPTPATPAPAPHDGRRRRGAAARAAGMQAAKHMTTGIGAAVRPAARKVFRILIAMFVWLIDMERLTFKIRKVVIYPIVNAFRYTIVRSLYPIVNAFRYTIVRSLYWRIKAILADFVRIRPNFRIRMKIPSRRRMHPSIVQVDPTPPGHPAEAREFVRVPATSSEVAGKGGAEGRVDCEEKNMHNCPPTLFGHLVNRVTQKRGPRGRPTRTGMYM